MNRVDEHGKIFTERVRKSQVEVRIMTSQGEIHGNIHVTPEQRVKDLLNNTSEQFLAVTDATITVQGSLESRHIEFIALNKRYVMSVIPTNEESVKRQQDGEYYMP
jgi:hypothetical protein